MRESARETAALVRNLYICFFLSGALGLVYQILWLRKLLLVFGSTVHAVSTVLTVFFGGLAIGSWFFGRLIDRREESGLRWYALLEAGVGVYAFATPPLFDLIQHFYIPIYRALGFSSVVLSAASFIGSGLILLLPTILLGGTFPVLSRFLIRSAPERGKVIAGLYGVNTAGAMSGTLLVYFFGLPMLGLQRTLLCAGVLNVGIGMLCLTFDRHLAALGFRQPSTQAVSSAKPTPQEGWREVRWLLLAFALSGFSAMVYEVAWTRALSLVVGSSTYAFCIMLSTFLGGMAIGSLVAREHLKGNPATVRQFITMEIVLGIYGLFSIPLFSQLPEWFVTLWPLIGRSFSAISWLQFLLSSLAMILPTLLMGLLFPLVGDLVTHRLGQLGERLGGAYAANTFGGIVGSFLSGFFLIPAFGLPWAIAIAALVNGAAGLLLYVRLGAKPLLLRRLTIAGALLLGALALAGAGVIPLWQREVLAQGVYINPDEYQDTTVSRVAAHSKLLYYRDSLNTTVSVHQRGDLIFLKVGGKTDASSGVDMGTQVLSAHIPLLLHADPEQVLVIGLGSGVTLGSAGRHPPVRSLHCVEIDPAVIEGARYFRDYNDRVHEDPRVRFFVADGRNFLLASPWKYDVIISEPSNPWISGLAYLFTQEFYELAKRRLASGGLMCQWLQLYGISPLDVKLMLKTFHAAFPYVSVWSSVPGDILLIGSMEPHAIDYPLFVERVSHPSIRSSLARLRIDRPEVLLQLFWMGNRQISELTADISWLHQDDQPFVEFDAPKALYNPQAFLSNYTGLQRFKSAPGEIVAKYEPPKDAASFYRSLAQLWSERSEIHKEELTLEDSLRADSSSSETWVRLAQVRLRLQRPLKAEEALKEAIRVEPSNAAALRLLAQLYKQQGRFEEAGRFYEQAASLQAPDGVLAQELGDARMEEGDARLASEYYRSALSQDKDGRSRLLEAYARSFGKLGLTEKEEEALHAGLSTFPREPLFPILLGEFLVRQKRWHEAESFFRRALQSDPMNAGVHYGLAQVMHELGDSAQAEQYLRSALLRDPYHREALRLLQQMRGSEAGS